MALRLSQLVQQIPGSQLIVGVDPVIVSVTSDSRKVTPGAVFVAVKGFSLDGSKFALEAVKKGAVAVIAEDQAAFMELPMSIGQVLAPESRMALAIISDRVYGQPSRRLKLIGATGTNGKTSTISFTTEILNAAGIPSASLGTLGLTVRGHNTPGDRTTPESYELQKLLYDLVEEGIQAVAMEVSSHALSLKRTAGLCFDIASFSNLTQDHLDYHTTLEEYYQAKRLLFTEYPSASSKPFTAVINVDDPYGSRLAGESAGTVIRYGLKAGADLIAIDPEVTVSSVAYTVKWRGQQFPVRAPIGAHFNVYNSLSAVGIALALGIDPEIIQGALQKTPGICGRFESVSCGQPFTVLVDYAHTPDGLSGVLKSARQITRGHLITVFGCGGHRDTSKRPLMGAIAANLSDTIIITSDNPRDEDPLQIIEQIVAGIPKDVPARICTEWNRREAIRLALDEARPQDTVVIAGKGHETYQIFADHTIHFDDREVVRELLTGGDE